MTAVETQIDDLLAELRPILIDLTACGYSVDSLASAIRRRAINDLIRLSMDRGCWPPPRRN